MKPKEYGTSLFTADTGKHFPGDNAERTIRIFVYDYKYKYIYIYVYVCIIWCNIRICTHTVFLGRDIFIHSGSALACTTRLFRGRYRWPTSHCLRKNLHS